jgi:hypothetical protein
MCSSNPLHEHLNGEGGDVLCPTTMKMSVDDGAATVQPVVALINEGEVLLDKHMHDMLPVSVRREDIPREVTEAAELVNDWMVRNGLEHWQLGPVADRKLVHKLEQRIKILELQTTTTPDDVIKWIREHPTRVGYVLQAAQ